MDREGRDKYPDVDRNNAQAGLEVNPYNLPLKPAFGPGSPTATGAPYGYLASGKNKRSILGLSVLVFWGLVVLLVVLLAGGIGGGVGAGLASRKSICSR
jgi:hypothetical protein